LDLELAEKHNINLKLLLQKFERISSLCFAKCFKFEKNLKSLSESLSNLTTLTFLNLNGAHIFKGFPILSFLIQKNPRIRTISFNDCDFSSVDQKDIEAFTKAKIDTLILRSAFEVRTFFGLVLHLRDKHEWLQSLTELDVSDSTMYISNCKYEKIAQENFDEESSEDYEDSKLDETQLIPREKSLKEFLFNCPNLEVLKLNRSVLYKKRLLNPVILPKLRVLELRGVLFNENSILQMENLTHLDISGCNGDIVTLLLRSLKKISLIRTLICAFLSKHELSHATSALIEYLDTDQKLNHLCWNGNGMSKDNMLSILKILKKNKTLLSLDLRKNGLVKQIEGHQICLCNSEHVGGQ